LGTFKPPHPENHKKTPNSISGTRGLHLSINHQNHLSVQCVRNRPEMRSATSCGMSKKSGAMSTSSSSLQIISLHKNMPSEVSNALTKVKATIYFFLIYYFICQYIKMEPGGTGNGGSSSVFPCFVAINRASFPPGQASQKCFGNSTV
jgi:hypothetical protein